MIIGIYRNNSNYDGTIEKVVDAELLHYQPYLQVFLDTSFMKEGRITNTRIKEASVALKETTLNIHGHFVNNMLIFIASLNDLLSDEVINPFM